MSERAFLGFIGIGFGATALMTVLVHLWAGPVLPEDSLEVVVSKKAEAIRDAVVATVKGAAAKGVEPAAPDIDWLIGLGVVVAAVLSIVLGVVSFARNEPNRVGASAVFLGLSAVAFQMSGVTIGIMTVIVLLAIAATRVSIS